MAILSVTFQSRPSLVPDALIVGRAVCGASTVVLTEGGQLVRILSDRREVAVQHLKGLASDDRPWGLACPNDGADGALWTLASSRTLAEIDAAGRIRARISLRVPAVAVFGGHGRLLLQYLAVPEGAPVLSLVSPRLVERPVPWPALRSRPGRTLRQQIARNFVMCGIGAGASLPCWFADEDRVVISDGSTSVEQRVQRVPASVAPRLDRAMPVWDFALAALDAWWLLVKTVGGPRASGSVLLTGRGARLLQSLDLSIPARLIVRATAAWCQLLTIDGRLVELTLTAP